MTEAIVANVALVVRVLLVGGILLVLPRITRRGLLFGVYVGEEFTSGDTAREQLRAWTVGCLIVMALALLVGLTISVAGRPVAGNFTGTGVLLVAALVHYIRSHGKIRELAPADATRQAQRTTVPLQGERPRGEAFAVFALVVCLVAGLATMIYAIRSYPALPDRVPDLRSALGLSGGLTDRSVVGVLYGPILGLVVSTLFALLGWLTSTAKRSMREGTANRSATAQESFRATNAFALSGAGLFICAVLTVYSVQRIRVGLSEIDSMGAGLWWLTGLLFVFLVVNLVVIVARHR